MKSITPQPHQPAPRRRGCRALIPAWVVALALLPSAPPLHSASPAPSTPAIPPVRPPAKSPLRFGLVTVDPDARSISFPARVNQTNGVLEYALVTDYGKTHESLLVTDAGPTDVQTALLLLRAKPTGTNGVAAPAGPPPPASAITIRVGWKEGDRTLTLPLHELVAITSGGPEAGIIGRLAPGPWLFNGSLFSAEGFAAHFEGSIISLIRDPIAVLNGARADQDDEDIHIPAPDRVPPRGKEVTVTLLAPRPSTAP